MKTDQFIVTKKEPAYKKAWCWIVRHCIELFVFCIIMTTFYYTAVRGMKIETASVYGILVAIYLELARKNRL